MLNRILQFMFVREGSKIRKNKVLTKMFLIVPKASGGSVLFLFTNIPFYLYPAQSRDWIGWVWRCDVPLEISSSPHWQTSIRHSVGGWCLMLIWEWGLYLEIITRTFRHYRHLPPSEAEPPQSPSQITPKSLNTDNKVGLCLPVVLMRMYLQKFSCHSVSLIAAFWFP